MEEKFSIIYPASIKCKYLPTYLYSLAGSLGAYYVSPLKTMITFNLY